MQKGNGLKEVLDSVLHLQKNTAEKLCEIDNIRKKRQYINLRKRI